MTDRFTGSCCIWAKHGVCFYTFSLHRKWAIFDQVVCCRSCCANCITPPPQNNSFNTQTQLDHGLFCCLTRLYGNWLCTGCCWGCDITLWIFTPVSAPRKQQQRTRTHTHRSFYLCEDISIKQSLGVVRTSQNCLTMPRNYKLKPDFFKRAKHSKDQKSLLQEWLGQDAADETTENVCPHVERGF